MSIKLSDFDIPKHNQKEFDSVALSKLNGVSITITSTEFRKLGKYHGVVMDVSEPVNVSGVSYNKVHTTIDRIVEKLHNDQIQSALKQDKKITFRVISGHSQNGTWYDIE